MSDLFISDQRWIYTNGETLSEALHCLADALVDNKSLITKSQYHVLDDECTTPSPIEVLYDPDTRNQQELYRVGICIGWKPGNADDPR